MEITIWISPRVGNNGELALDFFDSGYTHSAYLSLEDQLFADTVLGMLAIDVPKVGDANKDGFLDFFQISQGVTNLTTTGAYQLDNYGNGSTTATWEPQCRIQRRVVRSEYKVAAVSTGEIQPWI